MDVILRPKNRFCQAHNSAFLADTLHGMGKRGPKRPKYISEFYRRVLAANVSALASATFRTRPDVPLALAKETGFSKSTIQQIMDPDTYGSRGASIDLLDRLAKALDVQPYQLLLPNLDVRNPQVVRGALPGESAFYVRLRGKPVSRS